MAPTRRTGGKNGSKRHALVDEHGIPLSLVVTAANVHDSKQLDSLLSAKQIRQDGDSPVEENLCLDAGYCGKAPVAIRHGYVPHIRPRGEEAEEIKRHPGAKARRWIVEAFHSWINRFRKIVPRYEKTLQSFYALLHLAMCLVVLNKVKVIYG